MTVALIFDIGRKITVSILSNFNQEYESMNLKKSKPSKAIMKYERPKMKRDARQKWEKDCHRISLGL